jgi:FkbM family methyltransferase
MNKMSISSEAVIDGIRIDMNNPHVIPVLRWFMQSGLYEKSERKLFLHHFPTNMPIIELGAGIGVVACISNRHLTVPAKHIVVEANPNIIEHLERNRKINHSQFKIIHAAVSYEKERVDFNIHRIFISSGIRNNKSGSITVPVITLQKIAETANFNTFNLICDIEFSEFQLIKHEISFMRDHVKWFLVEIHKHFGDRTQLKSAMQILLDNGFALVEKCNNVFCYRNTNFD